MPILAIHPLTRGLQSTGKRGFRDGTHKSPTHGHCDFETDSAQWADSVKTNVQKCYAQLILNPKCCAIPENACATTVCSVFRFQKVCRN